MNFKAPVLTQQQLQNLLESLNHWPSPFSGFSSWEEVEDYKEQWVESAPESWFPCLLEACVSYNKEGDDEERDGERYVLTSLIEEWLFKNPSDWTKFSALLEKESTRSIALSVWAGIGLKADGEARQRFVSLADDLGSLSESEIVDLIDGLMDDKPASIEVLKRIEAFVPETMTEAKAELELYKRNLGIEAF